MAKQTEIVRPQLDVATQPVIYEIRVRGRIEGPLWARWFDGLDMIPDAGETILRGPVADQSALHGLLSRLRDLHLPLVSVNPVRDNPQSLVPAQHTPLDRRWPYSILHWKERSSMDRPRSTVNWLLILVYLLVGSGLATLTVFLTSEHLLETSLALASLFAMLGGIAFTFGLTDGGRGWRVISGGAWLAALIPLVIYLITSGWLHPALAIAILLFLASGAVLYFVARSRMPELHSLESSVDWERLGDRLGDAQTQSQRDVGDQPAPQRRKRGR